ncbi:hypothetical protein Rhopal_007374-T1 [Rhodotorula paludigena]|uniref:MFS transporter n=1 Tax=Rhodotorula paludigena TaxID=86838 RepID=A0AAV5GWG7_9BASI|nr:hypothetical protein Rhopal_007374-T1 [Rhodotorula paludigena]
MSSRLSAWLGLSPGVSVAVLCAVLSNALLSVSYLVLVNAASPFVLSALVAVPAHEHGRATGTLLLADELTALALYLPAGALADERGVKAVAVAGHAVVAAALVAYVQARTEAQLVAARVLFAIGGSSLVTTLSAIFSSLSAVPALPAVDTSPEDDERAPLLAGAGPQPRPRSDSSASVLRRHENARMAGVLGFASGLGALIAVFGFLRLPTLLPPLLARNGESPADDAVQARALRVTFYLVAALALVEAALLAVALPLSTRSTSSRASEPGEANVDAEEGECAVRTEGAKSKLRKGAKRLVEGFRLAGQSEDVALGYAASFAYFSSHDLCSPAALFALGSPSNSTRDSCRGAYILASILTGSIQLLSLLLSPLIGIVAARASPPPPISLSETVDSTPRVQHPQAFSLALSLLLGSPSFLLFPFLPLALSSSSPLTWLAIAGMGVAQAAGIVLSLALVTTGRGVLKAREPERECAGALSGAYGLSGGLGILLVGSLAGFLFDRWAPAPFVLVGVIDAIVAVGAAVLWLRA